MKKAIFILMFLVLSTFVYADAIDENRICIDYTGSYGTVSHSAGLQTWAEKFTASQDYTVGTIAVYGCNNNLPENYGFNVSIWTDAGANPLEVLSSSLESNLSDVTNCGSGAMWKNFTLQTPISLTNGVTYWIATHVNITSTTLNYHWCYDDAGTGTEVYGSDARAWTPYSSDNVFTFMTFEYVPPPIPPPTASFLAGTPANNTRNNTLGQNISIECTNNGNASITVQYYIPPPIMDITTYTVANTTINTTYWITNSSIMAANGIYYFWGSCGAGSINTSTRTFYYDNTAPIITLNSNNHFKTNNVTNKIYNESIILLNITVSDNLDLFGFEINITSRLNGSTVFYQLISNISNNSYVFNKTINITDWYSTFYDTFLKATDAHTDENIGDYKPKKLTNAIEFTTEEGNKITIESKDDADVTAFKSNNDRYSFKIDFADDKEKDRDIFIKSDSKIYYQGNSNFKAHFVISNDGITGNWVDFEGTSSNYIVVRISDYIYMITFFNLKDNTTFNSVGGLNEYNVTYSWFKGNYAKLAPFSTAGTDFTISINFTKGDTIKDIFTGLTYNGTYYIPTKENQSNYTAFSKTLNFDVPDDSSFIYTWNVSVLFTDNSVYSFSLTDNHSILNFVIDNCTITNNITAIFYLKDENIPNNYLDGTMVMEGTYTTGEITKTLNLVYTLNNTFKLCIYPQDATIYLDAYLKYTVPSVFTHRYYLVNESLTNNTKTFNIYNFNETTGVSDLKITVRKTADYSFYPNIIGLLQRRYLDEGVWRTVQMDKTGDFGQLFYNIIEENTDYRLIYWDTSKNILKTTQSLKFICTSGICDLTQKLSPYSSGAVSTNTTFNVSFNNATKILTMDWNNPEGLSTTIETIITRETLTGIDSLCTSTQTGTAGTVTCNTTGYSGTYNVQVYENSLYKYSEFVESSDNNLADVITAVEGAVWTFAIMATVIMFGLFSPVGAVISTILGLIFVYFIGIFNPITLTFVIVACVLGVVISLKVRN